MTETHPRDDAPPTSDAPVQRMRAEPQEGPHRAGTSTRPALVLTILAVAMFLSTLDLFVVNVALTSIGKGLHETSLSNLSWILNAYAIVYAALLVPAGRFADRYGRKGAFIAGLVLFTGASLGAAVSGSLWVLIVFRCLQAAGAATLTPASLGLVLSTAPAAKVKQYVQIWAVTGALAAALGPVVGGLLVEASWRWIFLLNLPIGVAAVAAALRLVPRVAHDEDARVPDLLGGALLIIGIGSLALGVVEGPDWGWGSARAITALVVAVAAVTLFVVRSAIAAAPLVELGLFRNGIFRSATVTAMLLFASLSMQVLSLILWMQDTFHWSAIETGLCIAPGALIVIPGSVISERLAARVRAGRIAALGGLLMAFGPPFYIAVTSWHHLSYASEILPGLLVVGVGLGLSLPLTVATATHDLPARQQATGSGVVQMAQQLGSVVGVSLLVVCLGLKGHPDPHYDFAVGMWVALGISIIAALAALGLTGRRRAGSPG